MAFDLASLSSTPLVRSDTTGNDAWAARLPNLLYALVTALAVGLIGRRSAGPLAGLAAAAAMGTFLLSYQVAIWLATDAPLLAAVAVALWGLQTGFYAESSGERLRGYDLGRIAPAIDAAAALAAMVDLHHELATREATLA